ncbi:autotransporter outer membrane beta-barrel domain-containing protein, partial [Acidithiobacillus ferrivorans]|nr:autotransporter outer membrane beta-barrel domain-containing protein [Acidithiobacillus ferrivorans]
MQEAKPILADSPQVTQAAIRDTAQTLISTGVVGGGPRGVWLKTLGGFSSQGGYSGMNYGLLVGYGKSVGPDGRDVLGAAFSAGQAGLGTGSSDFTRASDYGLWLYGTYYPTASRTWKLTGTIGGGMSSNTLMSTALGLPQTAHFGGSFMGTEIRASYWKTLDDGIIISPRLSLGYDQSWTNGYATHGGGPLDVNVSGQTSGQFYAEPAVLIGKKFNYRSQSGNHTIFPQLRLGAVENIGPNPSAEISSGQVAGQVQGLAYPHLQGMAEARLDVI